MGLGLVSMGYRFGWGFWDRGFRKMREIDDLGTFHRAHCRLASCHSKRRRFIAPLLARLLVLWKSFVFAWFRQLFCSLPHCRFRKHVGAPVLARLH